MTAVSDVAIAKRALSKIGKGTITSLTDDSEAARTINACYEILRDAELRRRKWRFALARAELPALATAPAFGYSYQYQLPADCLRVWSVGDYPPGGWVPEYKSALDAEDFAIEGRVVLTDVAAPLKIRYTARVTDPAQFDAAFVESFAARLAYEICKPLGGSTTDKEQAASDYKMAISEAVKANAIEAGPQQIPDDSWLLARE